MMAHGEDPERSDYVCRRCGCRGGCSADCGAQEMVLSPDAAVVEARARGAYEAEHGEGWEGLPPFMRELWRRHVTTGLPPR